MTGLAIQILLPIIVFLYKKKQQWLRTVFFFSVLINIFQSILEKHGTRFLAVEGLMEDILLELRFIVPFSNVQL